MANLLQHLPSPEKHLQVATFDGINGPERFQAIITMTAVQLLATCFTLPPDPERYLRPSASYHERRCPIGRSSHPMLISSLRLHTHFRNSPALGHHARNCSPALAWPDCRTSPSQEEPHAGEYLRQRGLQQLGNLQLRTDSDSRRARSNQSSAAMERNSASVISTSVRRRNRSSDDTMTLHRAPCQRRKVDSIHGRPRRFNSPPTAPLSHTSESQGARPLWRNDRAYAVRGRRWAHGTTYNHRYSFQPVLRSEDHPVFIQPVKEHIIRRWTAFRSKPKSTISKARPDQNLARARRKRNVTSESSTESSASTRRPSTESSTSNAGPIKSTAPSPEPVELDLTPCVESVQPVSLLTAAGALTAHSSVPTTSPYSPSLPASESTGALVDDQIAAFSTPSTAEQVNGRMPQRSSSTGTTLFDTRIVARASPDSAIMPSKDTGWSGSASSNL